MITSKDNRLIKYIEQIKTKKYSREFGVCFVETVKVVRHLYELNLIDTLILSEDNAKLSSNFGKVKVEIISSSLSKFLSDTVQSDGVFAICKVPKPTKITYEKCIILDGIQDPANFGAIIRCAAAFGFGTVFMLNSVYPYIPKAIRASMGYLFDINFVETDYAELTKIKQAQKIDFVVADMSGNNIGEFEKPEGNFAIIIGNEGNGVSKELRLVSDFVVKIPMSENVDSLNASVSAGIFMYLLK